MKMFVDKPEDELDGPWTESINWAFRFLFFLVGIMAIGWGISGIYHISPDSQAVVFRFGKVVRTEGPGLLISWPSPIERVVILPSSAQQIEFHMTRLESASDYNQDNSSSDDSVYGTYLSKDPRQDTAFLLTGDSSVVYIQATLFYHISDPVAYVISKKHIPPALQRLFLASAVSIIGSRDLNTVLVARPEAAAKPRDAAMREQLRQDLMNAVNKRLDNLARQGAGLGIQLGRVDITASIPGGAKAAFNHVLTVTQDVQKDIADAHTQAELTAQNAQQKCASIMAEATANANEMVNNAKTETASIEALGQQAHDSSHRMLMQRLYNDRIGPLFRQIGHIETVDPSDSSHVILPGDTNP